MVRSVMTARLSSGVCRRLLGYPVELLLDVTAVLSVAASHEFTGQAEAARWSRLLLAAD